MQERAHCESPEEVLARLSSSAEGLDLREASRRLAEHGLNEIALTRGRPPLAIFLGQFKDLMVVVLIFAAIIAASLGIYKGAGEELLDAAVIAVIVVINAILGFLQEYRAERTVQALRELAAPKANVVRGGRVEQVASRELVPGDVILLATGDKVPADARLMEAINLRVNEASLTGESEAVDKTVNCIAEDTPLAERTNMVFAGCIVEYGRGKAVVTTTGMQTFLGKIAGMVEREDEPTPLQKKLKVLGKQLGAAVLGACLFIFLVGMLQGIAAEKMFLTSVSLAVAAIPEGLPTIVTISLALGLQRMAKRNAIMRRLSAVEGLGSATVICTDKTGTLTKGEMNLREIQVGESCQVTGEGFEPLGDFIRNGIRIDPFASDRLKWLLTAGVLCNDAELNLEKGRWRVRGDNTEGTLLVTARKAGLDIERVRKEWSRAAEIPFDSSSKRMITVNERKGRRFAFLKGATESVLPRCDSSFDGQMLNEQKRRELQQLDNDMASRALRVLSLAMAEATGQEVPEKGFKFLGMVGMIDAPRKEAMEAVTKCKRAGIRVIMITGDHELTAKAIATEMGIAVRDAEAITGRRMESMSDEELRIKVKQVSVFARVSPEHKMRIVQALQRNGEVVAMTGDGVNDAPALKRADIGVAMGITGTDVAKESSEMILMDDNFASIVNAVEEGRGIYENIRRFIVFLLCCNAGEVATMFIASLLFFRPEFLPFLLPIQILWMNLVTDGLPAIALGLESTAKDVMDRPPIDPMEPTLNRRSVYKVLAFALIIATVTLLAFQTELGWLISMGSAESPAIDRARTVAFATIVMFQLLFAFVSRSDTQSLRSLGLLSNRKLLLAVGASVLLQLLVIYVPLFNRPFGTVALGWGDWIVVLGFAGTAVVANALWKFYWQQADKAKRST